MSLRDERGFTLIELLVVMSIAIGILSATLTTFNASYQAHHDNDARNDTAELARVALDVQARQLRNLAKRLNNAPVIDTISADGYDFIFQTADPAKTWVRYCLDTTAAPASRSRGRLWTAETSNGAVTAGNRGPCPGSGAGWQTRIVADHVTNRRDGLERRLFTYTCTDGTASCAAPATPAYDKIVGVAAQTLVDTKPDRGAPELRVATGVHLRNQNQAPEARFVATPSGSRTVVLNASGSTDFENRTLNYYWFKQTLPVEANINCTAPPVESSSTLWGATYIGSGITLSHTFPAGDGLAGSSLNVGLVVCDPGDRYGKAGIPPLTTVAVQIPN